MNNFKNGGNTMKTKLLYLLLIFALATLAQADKINTPILCNMSFDDDAYGPVIGGCSLTDKHGNIFNFGQVNGNNFFDFETSTGHVAMLMDDENGVQFHVFDSVLPGSVSISPTRGIVLTPPSDGIYRLPVTIDIQALSPYANNAAAIAGGLLPGNLYRTGTDPDVLTVVH